MEGAGAGQGGGKALGRKSGRRMDEEVNENRTSVCERETERTINGL